MIPAGGDLRLLAGVTIKETASEHAVRRRETSCRETGICVFGRPDRMARHRLGQGEQECSEPADTNRQGNQGAGLAQGESLAKVPDSLVLRQGISRTASDRESRAQDAGRGQCAVVHSCIEGPWDHTAQASRLSTAGAEARVHPEVQRQAAAIGDTNDEGSRDASALPSRAGTRGRNAGRSEQLWVPTLPLHSGRDQAVPNGIVAADEVQCGFWRRTSKAVSTTSATRGCSITFPWIERCCGSG